MMRGYAESADCRAASCSTTSASPSSRRAGTATTARPGIGEDEPSATPFEVGSRVRHADWGDGVVQRYEADKMVVLFDDVGYKTLSVELVVEHELLEPA